MLQIITAEKEVANKSAFFFFKSNVCVNLLYGPTQGENVTGKPYLKFLGDKVSLLRHHLSLDLLE